MRGKNVFLTMYWRYTKEYIARGTKRLKTSTSKHLGPTDEPSPRSITIFVPQMRNSACTFLKLSFHLRFIL